MGFLLACEDEGLEVHHQGIVNGDLAVGAAFTPTAALVLEVGIVRASFCSAVLIAPNVLLTAAHCLTDAQGFPFTTFWTQGAISMVFGEHIDAVDAESFEITHFVLHPKYDATKNSRDLALVYLDRSVPSSVALPLAYAIDPKGMAQASLAHMPATFVGFGNDEADESGARKKFDSFIYAYCGSGTKAPGSNCLQSTPDGMTFIMPLGSLAFDLSKGGACDGDSGGPVLADLDGINTVIGIVTAGDSDCRIYALATSLADEQAWIDDVLYAKKKGCSAVLTEPSSGGSTLWPISAILLTLLLMRRRRPVKRAVLENL